MTKITPSPLHRRRGFRLVAAVFVACSALVAPLALTAGALPGGQPVMAAELTSETLTDSADLTGPVVASGQVRNTTGGIVGAGQLVELQVWPRVAVLEFATDQTPLWLKTVGYAYTDASGNFEIRISDQATVDANTEPDGVANFQVVNVQSGALGTQSVPLTVGVPVTTFAEGDVGDLAAPTSVEGMVVEPLIVDPAIVVPTEIGSCTYAQKVGSLGVRRATVGRGYSQPGAAMRFTHLSGATNTLGVGASSTGTYGSWKASGSSTTASDSATSFAQVASGSWNWRTDFNIDKFIHKCTGGGNYYTAKTTDHAGGAGAVTGTTITANYCVSYSAGTSFTKSNSTASTASSGWDVSAVLGLNLSSKSGYNTSTKITFTFSKAMRLCGTAGYPGGTPGYLVAKP